MGNTTSVSPSEDDDMNTSSGLHPNGRKKHQGQTRRKAPTPEEESENESEFEDTVDAIEANERIDRALGKFVDERIVSATVPNAREVDKPSANNGSDEAHNRQQSVEEQMPTSKDDLSKSSLEGRAAHEKKEESKRLLEDVGSGSGTSSSGFYTNSSYSGSENSSEIYASEDDSDVVRNEKMNRGDDGHTTANGNREASDSAELVAAPNSSAASNRRSHKKGEQKDVTRSRRDKTKRRKSSKTHYIKDETMRTLFGLVPYYGGGDGPMDQMIKATLASVGPNTIDVRDEEGNTLLILACQHCCEDLIEPILAKGANPAAVNGFGGCPLHYTCYTYSMSLSATKALLLKGADPSATETTYGCTPLHYAASAGNVDLCTLLLEHGAQQQACDFYNCTAAKYALDAGHTAILELLGAGEAADIYMTVDLNEMTPSMGLWVRYMDPQSELAYVMNDETGESWWEIDLLAVAKDFIKGAAAVHDEATSHKNGPKLPPLAVREWLVQGQVWACLVAIFSKSDPLRLMEVDLVMVMGKADFKGMMKAVLVRYGVKDAEFLRNALSPKLKLLGVLSLIPTANELSLAAADKETSAAIQTSPGPSDDLKANEGIPKALTPVVIAIPEETSNSLEEGQTTCAHPLPLQREPTSRPSPKRVESRATRQSEADKALQEALLKQKRDRENESKRQNDDLDEQLRTILSLEEKLMKSKAIISQAKEGGKEATSALEKLQFTLADDSMGQEATSCFSEEIEMLKASLAGERTQFSHITEVLEATTGSTEEPYVGSWGSCILRLMPSPELLPMVSTVWKALDTLGERSQSIDTFIRELQEHREWEMKQMALEEERRVRLERIRSENDKNVDRIREESSASLDEATQAWKVERKDLERGLMEKIEYTRLMFEKATKDADKVLSEETEKINDATEDLKRVAARIEKTRMLMHEKDEVLASSKQLEQTSKQLHSSLRREMERAKQLHNQIEDSKGQIRIYARVRPMNFHEKEAGYKEVCVKDGKQKLAFLKDTHRSKTFTNVFQTSLEETLATEEEQAEVYQQVSGLGTTLVDGHSILILAAGATGSGKTMTLIGDQEEAKASGGFFPEAAPTNEGPDGGIGPTTSGHNGEKSNLKKGKRQGSKINNPDEAMDGMLSGSGDKVPLSTTPLAGILPRLLAETYAILNHRDAHSAFIVWVSAVHVSNTACPSDNKAVESLLAPAAMGVETPAAGLEGGRSDARNFESPSPAPPEDHIWGRAVEASSPQEAMAIVEDARSRAASGTQTGTGRGDMGHILLRFVVKLVNRVTNENSISEMVTVELAEESEGDTWPKALGEIVRAHAAATGQSKEDQGGGLLGMVMGCLRDTSKVLMFLCMSPAGNQAEGTQRTLQFGEACENSADNGASQLRELKKELARLKKESKSSRTITQSRLPRPASGREK